MQKAMVSQAIRSLGNRNSIASLIIELIRESNELQNAIGENGEVHFFLTTRSPGTSLEQINVLPVVSSLYHFALMEINCGSTIAAQALRDAFLLARRVASRRYPNPHPRVESNFQPRMELPPWFPWSGPQYKNDKSQSSSNIMCDPQINQCLGRSGAENVSEIYGKLLTHVWNTGRAKKFVRGRIIYSQMTPPRLR